MAQLALNAAGVFVDAAKSAAIGAAQAGIANLFAPDRTIGPRYETLEVQTSTLGSGIPLVYGRMRLAGQVIWVGRFVEHAVRESQGGKGGGPTTTRYSYTVSFAVGLCEGPIDRVGRVWANGEPLDSAAYVMRVHDGSEGQAPDAAIEAEAGAGRTPAFRGLAYAVFEDFPLDEFGARIPGLAFEVFRRADGSDGLEERLTGVSLIPASGEFAYSRVPVAQVIAPGEERLENVHQLRAETNVDAALDALAADAPNCGAVALVSAWFGSSIDCDACTLRPKAEVRDKETDPVEWRAAGLTRATADLVSTDNDRPIYGGTPADADVVGLIKGLKGRGYDVTLHPFILMDIPGFPWRGRISCAPAPGAPGSPDGTALAQSQIAAFVGTVTAGDFAIADEELIYSGPEEWSFSRFILHHAALAAAAGGVEAFLIGSEMRGLNVVRGGTGHPFVEALRALAVQVRALLGPDVKISYGADWSEYSGFSPPEAPDDRIFHLDPFWADGDVDFVGIDWYAPLSDWRDGRTHADAGYGSTYDEAYLEANVEGGEGFDWFYAGAADREVQTRTPITDAAYGEPWVWRYKDLRSWWSQTHHDRLGGVRTSTPTSWTPMSKPIRFTEVGCPAVDKGANQPNVFIDPKSEESALPYFSSGARDDFIQRRYLETLYGYWREEAGNNPVSPLYGGAMVDIDHATAWTWDARPFPEFPARDDVWSDAANWRLGHWLSGRLGVSTLSRVVADLSGRAGLDDADVSDLQGVVSGFIVDGPQSARSIIEQLAAVFGFDLIDAASGPAFRMRTRPDQAHLDTAAIVRTASEAALTVTRNAAAETLQEVRLSHIGDDDAYGSASAYGRGLDGAVEGRVDLTAPLLADESLARGWARRVLEDARAAAAGLRITLPPSAARFEPGDIVSLDAGPAGRVWRLVSLDGAAARSVVLEGAAVSPTAASAAGSEPQINDPVPPRPPKPALAVMDLPLIEGAGSSGRGGLVAAAWSRPWPGPARLLVGPDRAGATVRTEIDQASIMGELIATLEPGPEGRWDRAASLQVRLFGGALESIAAGAALAGGNRVAVETSAGWEVLAFKHADLIGADLWRLSGLIRRIGASAAPGAAASPGARVVVFQGAQRTLPIQDHEAGAELTVLAVPPRAALDAVNVAERNATYRMRDLRPLSPVHPRVSIKDGLSLLWIRRTRVSGDRWDGVEPPVGEAEERYLVELVDAADELAASYDTTAPGLNLTQSELDGVLPGGVSGARARIAQVSADYGPGAPREVLLG